MPPMPTQTKARYRQIASALEADILSGRLKVGDQLPSERAMAEQLGISRMTARKALKQLCDRGMLKSRIGHGTFVGTPVILQEQAALSGFTEEMERQGRVTTSIVVEAERRRAGSETSFALNLGAGADIYRLVRVRLADGLAIAVERTEIDAVRAPDLLAKADFGRSSLYEHLKTNYGIYPATAEQTLAAGLADGATALSLNLEDGAPILKLTRLTRDQEGRPFEFVHSIYRADAFVMKVNLSIGS